MKADTLIKEHRDLYTSTMKVFSDIETASGIKKILEVLLREKNRLMLKTILIINQINNQPETLRNADSIGRW